MPKKKPTTKKKVDAEFSKYIRARDCLKTTGSIDRGLCITCGKLYEFKKLQAGHYVSRRFNSVRFHEQNVHAQCFQCNIRFKGNMVEYQYRIKEMYGEEFAEELRHKKNETKQYRPKELEELYLTYKQKYDDLKSLQQM